MQEPCVGGIVRVLDDDAVMARFKVGDSGERAGDGDRSERGADWQERRDEEILSAGSRGGDEVAVTEWASLGTTS